MTTQQTVLVIAGLLLGLIPLVWLVRDECPSL